MLTKKWTILSKACKEIKMWRLLANCCLRFYAFNKAGQYASGRKIIALDCDYTTSTEILICPNFPSGATIVVLYIGLSL